MSCCLLIAVVVQVAVVKIMLFISFQFKIRFNEKSGNK